MNTQKQPQAQQHTPGPWTQEGRAVIGPDDTVVAMTYKDRNRDEEEANARLIALAPEMLEGLKAIVAALTQPATFPADVAYAEKAARAIIARADGASNNEQGGQP
jgi:hypothetical protein